MGIFSGVNNFGNSILVLRNSVSVRIPVGFSRHTIGICHFTALIAVDNTKRGFDHSGHATGDGVLRCVGGRA